MWIVIYYVFKPEEDELYKLCGRRTQSHRKFKTKKEAQNWAWICPYECEKVEKCP